MSKLHGSAATPQRALYSLEESSVSLDGKNII